MRHHAEIRTLQQSAICEAIMRASRTALVCGNPARKPHRQANFQGINWRLRDTRRRNRKLRGNCAMLRNLLCAPMLAAILFAGHARAQHIDTSMSDKQIITNILKECHELYARSVGDCACAADRTKEGTRCNKIVKDLPESFKPFCTRKDVTLREVSLYRMQNQGFIDRRCSK
jgi:hypothetical protein